MSSELVQLQKKICVYVGFFFLVITFVLWQASNKEAMGLAGVELCKGEVNASRVLYFIHEHVLCSRAFVFVLLLKS